MLQKNRIEGIECFMEMIIGGLRCKLKAFKPTAETRQMIAEGDDFIAMRLQLEGCDMED